MTDSIQRIREADLLRITGVARSTRSSWEKSGLVSKAQKRRFDERQAVEVAVFSNLMDPLDPALAQAAWLDSRDHILAAALKGTPGDHEQLDLLVNGKTAKIVVVESDEEVVTIIRQSPHQPHFLIPLAKSVNEVREAYWRYARLDKASDA